MCLLGPGPQNVATPLVRLMTCNGTQIFPKYGAGAEGYLPGKGKVIRKMMPVYAKRACGGVEYGPAHS
jgi:hypothetical protein